VASAGAGKAVFTAEPGVGKRNLRGRGRGRSTGVGRIGRRGNTQSCSALCPSGDNFSASGRADSDQRAPNCQQPAPLSIKDPASKPIQRLFRSRTQQLGSTSQLPHSRQYPLENYSPRKRCSSSVDNRTCLVSTPSCIAIRARVENWGDTGRLSKPRESSRARCAGSP
jgi:hypothetical protein